MANAPHAARRRAETERKRIEILNAATEVFGGKGYAKGTLDDIAKQVGITHVGVLHHFGSKRKLLLEVLLHRDRTDVEHLHQRHIPDGAALFLHLVRTAFANAQRPGIVQAYTVLSAESVTDGHPAREFFVARYERLRGEIAAAFGECCEQEGVTDAESIESASLSILAVMDGLQLQWLLTPGAFDLGEASEFAIRSIVNGVLRPGPTLEDRTTPAPRPRGGAHGLA